MGQATLSIRMDEDIKKRFDAFCADVGMNATVAVNMFARTVLRENRIPFEVAGSTSPIYEVKNQTQPSKIGNLIERLEDENICWVDRLTGIITLTEDDLNKTDKELIAEARCEKHGYPN